VRVKTFLTSLMLLQALVSGVGRSVAAVVPPYPYKTATIYYLGWDVEAIEAISPESVRKSPRTTITILRPEYASAFAAWLRPDDLPHASPTSTGVDTRLVIDLVRADGTSLTLCASRFYLFSADSKHYRPIGYAFRHEFKFAWE